ncbi:MAG TPA: hypothetical protein VE619_07585, partial [Nitrososphaeraceae archaeon]|nr:hypothetical protein [Nitrososphaeraceae archaeon]
YVAAGAIIVAAVAIFLIMGNGVLSNSNFNKSQSNINSLKNSQQPIKLSIKNIIASPSTNSSKAANIQVAFDAYNPNRETVILEAITYNLFSNGMRLTSGDIGAQLEGFIASQEGVYPIIGNSTITLKDTQTIQENSLTPGEWSKVINSKANYMINGTYSYRQTSSMQATVEDKDFKLTFP